MHVRRIQWRTAALAMALVAGGAGTASAQQPPTSPDTSRAARDSAAMRDTTRTTRTTTTSTGEVVPTRVTKDDASRRMPARPRTTPAPTTTTTPTTPTPDSAAMRATPPSSSMPDSAGAMGLAAGGALDAARAAAAPIIASMQTDAHALALLHESNVGEIQAGQRAQREASDSAVRAFAQMMVTEHTALDQQGMALGQRVGVTPALPDSALPQLQMRELQGLPTGTGAMASPMRDSTMRDSVMRDSTMRDSTARVPMPPDSSSAPNPTLPSSTAPTAGTTPLAGDTTARPTGAMHAHAGMAMGGTASGFDRAYVAQQVAAHARTLALVDAAITRAQQAELRTMLETQVRPSVAAHLRQAQQLQQRLGQ